jgi:hemerythrin
MAFLEWIDSYNIGIKEIDNQHRGLFDLISKLSNTKHYKHGEKYFFATLNTLMQYAELHFTTEERYMADARYPKLIEHQKEHADFLQKVSALVQELEKKELNIHQSILGFLRDWYTTHILGSDKDYVAALKNKGFK